MAGDNRDEYLEAIYGLLESGEEASTGALARALRVKDSSVTQMLKKLDSEGLVRRTPYKGAELTDSGLIAASKLKRKHRLLERFLHDVLRIGLRRVHEQACRMEHSLSDEAADALDRLMGHPSDCPDDHKPIPAVGKIVESLYALSEGSNCCVASIEGGKELKSKLHAMGLNEGRKLTVIAKEPLMGPVVVRVGNTRISIGRGMAGKVRVVRV